MQFHLLGQNYRRKYDFEFPDKKVFDWDLAMKKYNKKLDWKKIKQGPDMDDAKEIRKNHYKGNK